MIKVSHSARRTRGARSGAASAHAVTLGELIARAARRLSRAHLHFGHGTDNAWDEAAALVLHALGLPPGRIPARRRVGAAKERRALALIERRIRERIPAPYLTGRTWFAGIEIGVDRRVLIPRSAIAELIERGFGPWIDPARVRRVLDLGTGSGCIALACARALPRARVDATDVSEQALGVARANVRRLGCERRVRLVRASHFRGLAGRRYDIIVSNPPYVGARELARLPPEYRHEPRLALAAGRLGLDSVRVILRGAARHLRPRGILVVEVGNTERAVRRAFPRVPFTWLSFERGGGGVFLLTAEQLQAHSRDVRKQHR
ncbi:MAG TPA: 50S ribosomal protein L3 N(5)-glutamine methyltransferase [Steroidobacteraceae bacterium]|nr:50S ribosomal protein L3 N(5)-glutamine methyltransferase [Steroidobacteraceae bacterium]